MILIIKKKEKFVKFAKKDLAILIRNFVDFVETNVMTFIAKELENIIKINNFIVIF